MKRKILLLPLAEEDINQYIVYLAENAGPDIAVRFNESYFHPLNFCEKGLF